MAKNKYITDEEIHEIECAIYNNLPSPILQNVSEVYNPSDKEWLKDVLQEGEEYDYIEEWDGYVVTNKGRYFNVKHRRPLRPTFTTTTMLAQVSNDRKHYRDLFEKNGWKYDFMEILDRYIKEGWSFQVANTYREKWKNKFGSLPKSS